MRRPTYLSPTSIGKFLENQDNFYMEYLADSKPRREPQTRPMSVGSAFDAYTKSYLFDKLIGRSDAEANKFDFTTLFEKQVEVHNRDWALIHGKYCFDQYVQTGALADLFVDLEKSIGKPRFEMDIYGTVSLDLMGVPFLGKPDLFFVNHEACNVISDWKVNGYCGATGASPAKGYCKIIPSHDHHKDAYPITYKGMRVNGSGMKLHDVDVSWARQTVIYAWLCGATIGGDFIHAIDQVACNNRKNPKPGEGYPVLRFAQHRYRSDAEFQIKTFHQAAKIWELCQGPQEKFFPGMSDDESRGRCETLERMATSLNGPATKEDIQFMEICRD